MRMTVKNYILLFVLCLSACTNKEQNEQKEAVPAQSMDVRNALMGIWWDPEMPQSAAFQVKDSTMYYPDQFAEYAYELRGDSLFVHHENGDISSRIVKVTADTLILQTFEQEHTYTRAEPKMP